MTVARCIFAAELQVDADKPCGMHQHACTEIVCYLEGTGYLGQQGKRLRYQPDFVSVYQPGIEHSDTPITNGIQVCIGASGCGAEQLPVGLWQIDESITYCTQQILKEIKQPVKQSNQERLDILTGWLVLELHRLTDTKPANKSTSDHVNSVKQILDSRFNENIDFQELADNLYISPDYLRHIFKQSFGESPLNYLINRRLDSACELLNLTSLPIGEIARRVGLSNVYYFSRIFRKRLGMTPTDYRNKTQY